MFTLQDVRDARQRIAPYIRRTPTYRNNTLSKELGTHLYLKYELFQKTGSFKPRGAFNQMLQLTPEQRQHGVVAVSGGNYAQAAAYAGAVLGIRTLICMPGYTPPNYLEATTNYGAEVVIAPTIADTFDLACSYQEQGWSFLHPYDDPILMTGHGTIGLELLEDLPELTDLFISIGGGGLISGVMATIKMLKPEVRVWGVETEGADAMGLALKAGQVVEIHPTSLAKTLGAPVVASEALRLAQEYLQQHILVSDKEAFLAEVFLLERAKVITELAASCTLAAARQVRHTFHPDDHVALLLCGGNANLDNLIEYRRLLL